MAQSVSHPLVNLLGEIVLGKDGNVDVLTLTNLDAIGIYFSAHWCPPCRGFTPKLIESYNKIKGDGKNFEVIFASSDKSAEQFQEYYGSMPWLTFPYQAEKIQVLSSQYKVQGIPSLIIVNPSTGEIINKNGRSVISEDPEGSDFPWVEKTFWEVFTGELMRNDNTPLPTSDLRDSYIGLYFSAHWCGPCRSFTPRLIEWYNTQKGSIEENFELVFVSSDQSDGDFNGYFADMPWPAVPFSERKIRDQLSNMCEVKGIPSFVILDGRTGKIVTKKARGGVTSDPGGFPWHPKPHGLLNDMTLGLINEIPVLVIFAAGDGQNVLPLIEEHGIRVAEEAKQSGGDFEMGFIVIPSDHDLRGRILALMGLGPADTMALLNIPGQGCHYPANQTGVVTQQSVDEFLEAFREGNLPKHPLVG